MVSAEQPAQQPTEPQHPGSAAPPHVGPTTPANAASNRQRTGANPQQGGTVETLSYRRAPKLPVFLVLGGALGAIVGMFVGVLGSGNAMFTTGQVVGYMIAIFTLLGFSVGAVVALVLERRSLKASQEIQATRDEHPREDQQPTPQPDRVEGQSHPADQGPEHTPNPRPDVRD